MEDIVSKKRHSLAHLLAAAVLELYPDVKPTIGPAIENGFYYDFDFKAPITEKDLEVIEKKIIELLPTWSTFSHKEVSPEEARSYFSANEYKTELIEELAQKGETITFYTAGTFTDLCRGGHVEDMSEITPGSFKLEKIAGAYWRGDEKNKMLTRIYGIAFDTQKELESYVTLREEAEKRDHRKLGAQLKLFTISNLVGSGLPLFQPKGALIRRELENYLWELHKTQGYVRVWTPHLAKADLYHTSGHYQHYIEDMFMVHGKSSGEDFCVKPMNCPHHMQIFADNQFSYRDMPIRYFEPATVYRDEKTGQLGGLTRVRSITQDDGHLFCRTTQIYQEVSTIVKIIKKFYTTMGMIEGYRVRLSSRDDDASKWMGGDAIWIPAEDALKKICTEESLPYFEGKGEAAFYGPKLDFMFKDAIGREHQLATIQLDVNLPERFDLSYVNEEGKKERPVVIHRAISGSLERFMGVMIEHFGGAFPLWLSPTQIAILPVSNEKHGDYAQKIHEELKTLDIRTDLMIEDGLGKRIRTSKTNKIPYQIVIGDKEMESGILTIEGRNDTKLEISFDDLKTKLLTEIKERIQN